MRLHIGVIGTKQALGAFDGQRLDFIYKIATTVPALASTGEQLSLDAVIERTIRKRGGIATKLKKNN